jgi:hypothetical protein
LILELQLFSLSEDMLARSHYATRSEIVLVLEETAYLLYECTKEFELGYSSNAGLLLVMDVRLAVLPTLSDMMRRLSAFM